MFNAFPSSERIQVV